jgi:eukaryotic-like serine/threonine-protein kinase
MPEVSGISLGRLARGAFVGREREMESLRSAVEDAFEGRGGIVLLAGEPGIGKTRTAQELTSYAKARGLQVIWGRCHECDGAPAYWPWVQVIRTYSKEHRSEELRSVLGSGAPNIAQVVAEIREQLPDLSQPPILEPEQARFRLFDSVATFLTRAALREPLVLVLDDLHGSDKSSLLLLQFLARQMGDARFVVLGTYRDVEVSSAHPLFQLLGELAREPVSRVLPLKGLSEAEVALYIASTADAAVGPQLVRAVFRETEGNPFFVGEIVRLLVGEGRLVTPGNGSLAIPLGVRAVIERRLAGLTDDVVEILTLGAVMGREFGLPMLEQVCALDRTRLIELLDIAVTARLVVQVKGAFARYRFYHVLIREVLYANLPPTRRIELHDGVGRALERIYGPRPDAHLSELAHHYLQAASIDVERAVDYAVRAGDRAASQFAHEEAMGQYELALQALDLAVPCPIERRCDLLLVLSELCWGAGEYVRARRAARDAADLARQLHQPSKLARAALAVAGRIFNFTFIERDEIAVSLLEEALAALNSQEIALRALVTARLAEEIRMSDPEERRGALRDSAIELARAHGDPEVLAYVLRATYLVISTPEELERRLPLAKEIVRLAQQTGQTALALEGQMLQIFGDLTLGNMNAVRRGMDAYASLSEQTRQSFHLWNVLVNRVCVALFEGRFEEVDAVSNQALQLESQSRYGTLYFGAHRLLLSWLRGRPEEMVALLDASAEAFPLIGTTFQCVRSRIYCELARTDEARSLFDDFATKDFVNIPRDELWLFNVAVLAETSAVLGDARSAERLYDLLIPFEGRNVTVANVLPYGAVDRHLGLLASTMGRGDLAGERFERALQMNARMGAKPWVAHTQEDYAEMLLERGGPGDCARAVALLDAAIEAGRQLGMARLVQRALSARDRATDHCGDLATAGTWRAPGSLPSEGLARREGDFSGPAECIFRREGDFWTVVYAGHVCRVKDTRGLNLLVQLLRQPGRELHVYDLAGGSTASAPRVAREEQRDTRADLGSAGDLLDAEARAQYRRRVAELRQELEEAESLNDAGRAERARTEIEAIAGQLGAALGLGGRRREAGAASERARLAVTKGIKGAIRRIQEHHPSLGRHLAAHVKTGYFCIYNPDIDHPVSWTF